MCSPFFWIKYTRIIILEILSGQESNPLSGAGANKSCYTPVIFQKNKKLPPLNLKLLHRLGNTCPKERSIAPSSEFRNMMNEFLVTVFELAALSVTSWLHLSL
jgi:hypothetical protein